MIIGITGNSGSGKTELLKTVYSKNFLQSGEDCNIEIINADEIAKKMSVKGKPYFNEIVKEFGEDILLENGEIDRKKLANIIFNDEKKRDRLNNITFKYVVDETKNIIKSSKADLIILDAPLLIESKLNKICDVVVSIIADEDVKIKRICTRDNIDKPLAKARIDAQPSNDFYIKNSNYVIINNEGCNLKEEAQELLETVYNSTLLNDEVVIIKNKDIKYMQFKKLLEFNNIEHVFTLRPLDFGDNKSLSLKKDLVNENYKKICKSLELDSKNIVRPYQTHTSNVNKITDETGIFPQELNDIDGLITDKKDKILSLTFADCTPIYLYDKEKGIIGNIHSGWQGTTKKIAKQAIIKMKQEFKSDPKNIICVIGPTIRKCHFEVKQDVRDIFYNIFKYMENINEIIELNGEKDTYFIDTVAINKNLLKEEGILEENIIDSKICTYCNSRFLHSYRKDKEDSGRNTSLICIKGED